MVAESSVPGQSHKMEAGNKTTTTDATTTEDVVTMVAAFFEVVAVTATTEVVAVTATTEVVAVTVTTEVVEDAGVGVVTTVDAEVGGTTVDVDTIEVEGGEEAIAVAVLGTSQTLTIVITCNYSVVRGFLHYSPLSSRLQTARL